jgi:predicted dehydrogenase
VAITVDEAMQLVETSRRYGRIYQAGTQQRSEYGGKFRKVCELVRNGRLGKLQDVYTYGQPGCLFPRPWTSDVSRPVPDGFDWDLWLGPLPWRPFGGEAGHTLSGMFIGDVNWAPHRYDITVWTVNPDPKAPVEVWIDGGDGRPDTATVHYQFSNGVTVHSSAYPGEKIGPDGGACFVGTEGRIAVERSNIASYPARILEEPLKPDDQRVYFSDSHSGNFLECVRSRRPTICNPAIAAQTMSTILIGGIALALGRRLKFDPVSARFINDDQANRLLSYVPRPPWL